MHQSGRINPTTIALGAIALLLLCNLLTLLSRNDHPQFLPAAFAQRQQPIAGGAGLFVMPAQLSGNTWGCYLMDVDRGTLCVYQFIPGTRQLQFVAARNFVNDRRLMNFNTTPSPAEIADLADKEAAALRGPAPAAPDADQPRPKE
jgi:hypothetical protein